MWKYCKNVMDVASLFFFNVKEKRILNFRNFLFEFKMKFVKMKFMLLCFIECMFGWSFVLLCDHCSHFYMTVLVYEQVAHMFHIMFTWSQFTCYIILVVLLLALPWGSNVFYASVSGYKYICSKCIIASHHFEGEKL